MKSRAVQYADAYQNAIDRGEHIDGPALARQCLEEPAFAAYVGFSLGVVQMGDQMAELCLEIERQQKEKLIT